MQDSNIEAAIVNDFVLLRLDGRGSFLNSRILKDFLERMLDRDYSQFIFDLSDCQTMDSTFMGMLAGVAIKLKEKKDGSFCLVSPNKQCYRLLSTLGLDQILEVRSDYTNPSDVSPEFQNIPQKDCYSQKEKLIHAIEAHKNLIQLEADNKVKFENVLKLLEEDLEKYKDLDDKTCTDTNTEE